MRKICISKEWMRNAPCDGDWQRVDLPDDYAIRQPRDPKIAGGPQNGFYGGGFARYVKYLQLETEDRHLILDIDGAYMNAEIRLNDQLLAIHPHGYTPFLVELTNKVRSGRTNKLEIDTNALLSSTRWYAGAGIYRDVFLWSGGIVRVEPWDIFVKTPRADEKSATVEVCCQVSSDLDTEAVISFRMERQPEQDNMESEAEASVAIHCKAGAKTPVSVVLNAAEPSLWSPDSPNLYRLHTEILVGGTVTDTADTVFGIRTISADAKHGFLLNGKPIKLRGGCIHHDHAVLGAAEFPAAAERKVSLLKAAGFNALRISHNPPSVAMLEICDRMGMLVMDEAFDMWNERKNDSDYHLWFADWWQRDLSYMVLRDRNHPCVISYSIGNEIGERDGNSDGAAWSEKLSAHLRKYDDTRPVTSAICCLFSRTEEIDPEDYRLDCEEMMRDNDFQFGEVWADQTEEFAKPLDIVGYNYLYPRYEADHVRYPERVMWGSETHALDFYDSWQAVLKNNYVLGDFTWTAYDNLGEVGCGRFCWERDGVLKGISMAEYPWRSCYQGDLDLCGYRRPQSYFREAVWLGGTEPKIFTTHPEHYGEGFSGTHWHWYDVLDTWTFADCYLGKPVKAEVYTDADEVTWYLNDRILGSSKVEKGIASFDIPYEKGTLTAVAQKGGQCFGQSSLHTVGIPVKIGVSREKERLRADNRDLCYFRVTVEDKEGSRVPHAKNELTCLVEGGELLGIFSGDPKNEDEYTTNRCHAFEGRALVIVRTKTPGTVTVTVGSPGLFNGTDRAEAV